MLVVNPVFRELSSRFTLVRAGLALGFDDTKIVDELRQLRGGVWLAETSGESLPYESEQFDVVVLNGEILSSGLVVEEAHRVLKPGGCMIFSVKEKNRAQPQGYALPDIYKFVKDGFDIVSLIRPHWYNFKLSERLITICGRKKNWHNVKSLGGRTPLPFFVFWVMISITALGGNTTSAQALVQLLNSRTSGSPIAYAKAAELVRADANNGGKLQRYIIAFISQEKFAPPAAKLSKDEREEFFQSSRTAIESLAKEKNNPLAWYLLSVVNNDTNSLKRAVNGGNVQALNAWGTMLIEEAATSTALNEEAAKKMFADAYECFKRAAAKNDINAQYNLGMCYINGYGCERNENMALASFRSAAEAGHPEAINNIGGLYRDGIIIAQDPAVATKWFAKSAEMGNAYGQLNYALQLQRGIGEQKDLEKAAALLKAAAIQDCPEAMTAYGLCLFKGEGVKQNYLTAVEWFRRSAEYGFAPAMDNLSECYDKGYGVNKDSNLSLVWRIRAKAATGDRNAAAWLKASGYSLK